MQETIKYIQVPHNFTPRAYQLKFFKAMDNGVKRAFLRWHRRAGKDKACFCYMVKRMMMRVGGYYYVLPSYAQGRKIIWEGIDKDGFKLLDHIPEELIAAKNNQEMILTLKNGSYLRVIGADSEKVDTLVGTNPVMLVLSEFGVGDDYRHVLALFRPILRENDGILIVNGTPRGRNHMFELEQLIKNSPDWYFSALQTIGPDYYDGEYSGILTPEQIQKELDEGMPQDMIEQEYGVSYNATSKGRIYEEVMVRAMEEGRIGAYPADTHRWTDCFLDLGYDDSTSIVFRQLQQERIKIVDYFEDSGQDIAYYVQKLIEKGYKYRTIYLPHDGGHGSMQTGGRTARDIFEECLRDAGIYANVVVCPRMSVMDGIQGIRKLFGKLHFNDTTTKHLQDCLLNYKFKYDMKRDILLKEPVHDWTSHACDAIRQMINAEETEEEQLRMHKPVKVISDFLGDDSSWV